MDRDNVARLDWPGSELISSADPLNKNNDFNNFIRKGPPGWIILADLQGPGCLTRFWFTGCDESDRLRFFFDGEQTPRVEITFQELRQQKIPFVNPLASYDNASWHSYVPMPFAKNLVIMVNDRPISTEGWPRRFYHINHCRFPPTSDFPTFPVKFSEADHAALERVRSSWLAGAQAPGSARGSSPPVPLTVPPAGHANLPLVNGPGILRRLAVTVDFDAVPSAVEREQTLRNVLLQLRWNASADPSVAAPLGDFFGSVWRRTRIQSLYWGMTGNTFICTFPMPFEKSALLSFDNQGGRSVSLKAQLDVETLPRWDRRWGYLHAAWNRSLPDAVGQPHEILTTKGAGKVAGCILSAASYDKSWWLLEGNETIRFDGETRPAWRGTGLEDYFNGGWYYAHVLARPLHGLPFKAPFRTVQYRLHLTDAPTFRSSCEMAFERGPDNASHGYMESMVFYYLDRPHPAAFDPGTPTLRRPPDDPFSQGTLMTEICNMERLGDFQGAHDIANEALEKNPAGPFESVLRLRQIAILEKLKGSETARPLYDAFIRAQTNESLARTARMLADFHTSSNNAILGVYSSNPTRVFLDGQELGAFEDPQKVFALPLKLASGRHVLALETRKKQYPEWIQIALRTGTTNIVSDIHWKFRFSPAGNWTVADFDDASWPEADIKSMVKDPPEIPVIWTEPNPFIEVQSAAMGMWVPGEWPAQHATAGFRKSFVLP